MGLNKDEYLVIKSQKVSDGIYPFALLRFLYAYEADAYDLYKVRDYYYMFNSMHRGFRDIVDREFKNNNLAAFRELLLGTDEDAQMYINTPVKIGVNNQGYEVIAEPTSYNKFNFTTGKYVGIKGSNNIELKLNMAGVSGSFRSMGNRLYGIGQRKLYGEAAYEFLLDCHINDVDNLVLKKLAIAVCNFTNIRNMQANVIYNLAESKFSGCNMQCKYINFGMENEFRGCVLEVGEIVNLQINSFLDSKLTVDCVKNLVVSEATYSVFKFNRFLDYSSIMDTEVVEDDDNMTFEEGDFCKFLKDTTECEFYFYGGVDEAGMKQWLDLDESYAANVYYFTPEDYEKFKDYKSRMDIRLIR